MDEIDSDQSSLLIKNLLVINSLSNHPFPRGMSGVLRTEKLFARPNRAGFELISYYLIKILKPAALREKQVPWPVVSRDQEVQFTRKIREVFDELTQVYPDDLSCIPHVRHINSHQGAELLSFLRRLTFVALRKVSPVPAGLPKGFELGNVSIDQRMGIISRGLRQCFRNSLKLDSLLEKDLELIELREKVAQSEEELQGEIRDLSLVLQDQNINVDAADLEVIPSYIEARKELLEAMMEKLVGVSRIVQDVSKIDISSPPEIRPEESGWKSVVDLMKEANSFVAEGESGALKKLTAFQEINSSIRLAISPADSLLQDISVKIKERMESLEDFKEEFRRFCERKESSSGSEPGPYQSPEVDFSDSRPPQGGAFTPKAPKNDRNILRRIPQKDDEEINIDHIIDSPLRISVISPVSQARVSEEEGPRRPARRSSLQRIINRYANIKSTITN